MAFMKKLFSIILTVVFLFSLMANFTYADEVAVEDENQITNIAPKGIAYSSSEKNSLWTPVDSVINGKYGGVDGEWQGWECAYPEVSVGQDTSMGFSGEYFGINFNSRFYEIHEIKMNIGLHTLSGGQNATYTFEALIDGKWEQFLVLKDDQAVPTDTKYADYNAVMNDPNASTRVNATLYHIFDEPVSTNNIKVTVSDYGKNYEGGDVLIFPFVYELELFGKKGFTPDLILPEGASYSTDVAWHSYPSASQGSNGTYPFLAIDGNDETYWEVVNYQGGEYFTLIFDKRYEINSVKMLLALNNGAKPQSTDLEYYLDDTWHTMDDTKAALKGDKEGFYWLEYKFTPMLADGIRVKFKKASDSLKLCSIEAHLNDAQTYAFDNRFTQNQLSGASNGNLAIIGKPYADVSFTPYSNVSFINDGLTDKLWFTGTIDVPAHCGLTFDFPQKISRAVITVKSMYTYGIEAMRFEIQALIDGEYVKVAEGKSYNEKTGYTTEYTFDEVETTDIRVVITEMGGAIPNVAELQLFNKDSTVLPMLNGIEKRILQDSCVNSDNSLIDNHICERNTGYIVPLTISIGALAIVCAVIILVVKKKKNKEV